MSKKIIVERCFECFYNDVSYGVYLCTLNDYRRVYVKDLQKFPKWCQLENNI